MSKSYPPIPYGTRVKFKGEDPDKLVGTVRNPVKTQVAWEKSDGWLTNWKLLKFWFTSRDEIPGMDYKKLGLVSVAWDGKSDRGDDGYDPNNLEVIPPVKRRFRDGLTE